MQTPLTNTSLLPIKQGICEDVIGYRLESILFAIKIQFMIFEFTFEFLKTCKPIACQNILLKIANRYNPVINTKNDRPILTYHIEYTMRNQNGLLRTLCKII